MECRRYVPGPEIYHPDRFCDCIECARENRRRMLLDELEVSLRRPLVQLLDFGMMPLSIAAAVRERVPRKSRAWMMTRIELTHQAGYWLNRPSWADQLEQVDQLSKHTGFKVGLTLPGWMHDWNARRGWVGDDELTTSVTDVWMALASDLEASESFGRPLGDDEVLVAGRPSLPQNVVRFPERSEPNVRDEFDF